MRRFSFPRSWRQTSQQELEERISSTVGDIEANVAMRPRVILAPGGASTDALAGDLVLCPTSCAVTLPIPTLDMLGRSITVISQSGTVIVRPTVGTVAGASSVTLTTRTPRDFWCSGSEWH